MEVRTVAMQRFDRVESDRLRAMHNIYSEQCRPWMNGRFASEFLHTNIGR